MWAFLSCHWPGECAVHGQKRFFNVQQREAAIEMNMKKKKKTMLHTMYGQIYNKYKNMIGKHTSMFASNTGER